MPSILIICTGNVCRSPMARAMLEAKLAKEKTPGTWRVASAGTWAQDGQQATDKGQQIMKRMGLDTSRHRSRTVNAKLLQSADLVLTMEHGHKEALTVEFPESARKIHLLTEMAGHQFDVEDPYGGTLIDYRDTALEIQGYIVQGFGKIVQLANAEK